MVRHFNSVAYKYQLGSSVVVKVPDKGGTPRSSGGMRFLRYSELFHQLIESGPAHAKFYGRGGEILPFVASQGILDHIPPTLSRASFKVCKGNAFTASINSR